MTNAAEQTHDEPYEEDYEEYDEFDDDDDRGLPGFVVLIMGIVMIGAFVSVVWIAYKQGLKVGGENAIETPYVAADPDPIKIETADDGTTTVEDREVYDALDGDNAAPVTTLAEGPEEPVDRSVEDTIGALAAGAEATEGLSEEVEDRLASLQAEDEAAFGDEAAEAPATEEDAGPATTSVTPANVRPASRGAAAGSAIAGTHVVQVGAFRSNDEAMNQWARLESRLGDYLSGKAPDVEMADLGDRGVYHRLRIGPFTSSDDAKTYCSGLKERGQDCLVKSK